MWFLLVKLCSTCYLLLIQYVIIIIKTFEIIDKFCQKNRDVLVATYESC